MRASDTKRTDAIPYITNPKFISQDIRLDHYCRRREVELLEMELNNSLYAQQVMERRIKDLDAAAATQISELTNLVTTLHESITEKCDNCASETEDFDCEVTCTTCPLVKVLGLVNAYFKKKKGG